MKNSYGMQMDDDKIWFELYMNETDRKSFPERVTQLMNREILVWKKTPFVTKTSRKLDGSIEGWCHINDGDKYIGYKIIHHPTIPNRFLITKDNVPLTQKEHNAFVRSMCNGLGTFKDTLLSMITGEHKMGVKELSFLLDMHPDTVKAYLKDLGIREFIPKPKLDSRIEDIIADFLTTNNIPFTRPTIQYICENGKHTTTKPDFLFGDKVILYLDGFTHAIPKTQERDARQNQALTSMGYRVIRISIEDQLKPNYPLIFPNTIRILHNIIIQLALDRSYDINPDIKDIADVIHEYRKSLDRDNRRYARDRKRISDMREKRGYVLVGAYLLSPRAYKVFLRLTTEERYSQPQALHKLSRERRCSTDGHSIIF